MVCLTLCLFSERWDFERLLKPAVNKQQKSFLKGVDFIYIINLDQRPEKYEKVRYEFIKHGLDPYRFSAVNGWELSAEQILNLGITMPKFSHYNQIDRKLMGTYYTQQFDGSLKEKHAQMMNADRPMLCHCMSRGAIGIVLSHLSILKDAYDSGYQRVWITEDDIEILGSLDKIPLLIEEANNKMKNDWDILYTDKDTKSNLGTQKPVFAMAYRPDFKKMYLQKRKITKRKVLSKNLILLGNRYGAYSYLINRSGMRKILDFYKNHGIFHPFDMDLIYVPNLKQIALTYNLVSTKINSPSDNGGPNYQNKE